MSDNQIINSNKAYNISALPAHDPEYINKKNYAQNLGVTTQTISGWMKRHWQRGVHYIVIGRTTLLHKEEVKKWLNNRTYPVDLPSEKTNLKSNCGEMENAYIVKRLKSSVRPMRDILKQQLKSSMTAKPE